MKRSASEYPVEVYYSYASSGQDQELFQELERHLKVLEDAELISGWHWGKLLAGSANTRERLVRLDRAQLILLLISPDFVASPETYDIEMKQALIRQAAGKAQVISILLRSVFYEKAPFAHLRILPDNVRPIASWANRDEAFENVVRGIYEHLDHHVEKVAPAITSILPPAQPSPGSNYENHINAPVQGLVIGTNNHVTIHFHTNQTSSPTHPSTQKDMNIE